MQLSAPPNAGMEALRGPPAARAEFSGAGDESLSGIHVWMMEALEVELIPSGVMYRPQCLFCLADAQFLDTTTAPRNMGRGYW